MARLGVVAIGRNEGTRLERCLRSVVPMAARVVYVDSGSTDGSCAMARGLGVEVLDLVDLSVSFTAARARNAGFRRLMALAPGLEFVLFVDGDCEVLPAWPDVGVAFLEAHPAAAAVCGWRRERHPEDSVYNRLCDLEWRGPVGEVRSFGGDVILRSAALASVEGYRDTLIAGEEPELGVRLRRAGWSLWRLSVEMTVHDASLLRFAQWWRRTLRGGFGFAEGALLHGAPPERHYVAETRRALAWGLVLPLVIAALTAADARLVLLALVYPAQVLRLMVRFGFWDADQQMRALFMVIARFPEAVGVLKFHLGRALRRRSALIEYK